MSGEGNDAGGGDADTVAGTGADTVVGGGADTVVGGGADTLAGGYKWEGLDDDLKGFVGTKTPTEIAKEAFAHKRSATQRAEQILKNSGALPPPEAGKEMEFFAKFAPADIKAYGDAAKEIFGDAAGGVREADMKAAQAAGLHPAQFRTMIETLKADSEAEKAAGAAAFEKAIASSWGNQREANVAMVARAAKVITPGMDVEEVIAAITAVNPKADPAQAVRQLDVLRQLGERLEEGVIDPNGAAAKSSAADERAAIKARAVAAGGIQNLSAADRQRLEQLQSEA